MDVDEGEALEDAVWFRRVRSQLSAAGVADDIRDDVLGAADAQRRASGVSAAEALGPPAEYVDEALAAHPAAGRRAAEDADGLLAEDYPRLAVPAIGYGLVVVGAALLLATGWSMSPSWRTLWIGLGAGALVVAAWVVPALVERGGRSGGARLVRLGLLVCVPLLVLASQLVPDEPLADVPTVVVLGAGLVWSLLARTALRTGALARAPRRPALSPADDAAWFDELSRVLRGRYGWGREEVDGRVAEAQRHLDEVRGDQGRDRPGPAAAEEFGGVEEYARDVARAQPSSTARRSARQQRWLLLAAVGLAALLVAVAVATQDYGWALVAPLLVAVLLLLRGRGAAAAGRPD